MNALKRRIGQYLSCWLVLHVLACENVDAHLGANDKGTVAGGAGGSSEQAAAGASVDSVGQAMPGGASAGGTTQATLAGAAAGGNAQTIPGGTSAGSNSQPTTAGVSGARGFLGAWQAQGSQSGYQSYMIIEDARGFFCCDDGKSEATFTYAVNSDGQLILGSYGYGSGDTLILASSGAALQRNSVEKGVTFTTAYVEVATVPAWCQQQIDTMRKSI